MRVMLRGELKIVLKTYMYVYYVYMYVYVYCSGVSFWCNITTNLLQSLLPGQLIFRGYHTAFFI